MRRIPTSSPCRLILRIDVLYFGEERYDEPDLKAFIARFYQGRIGDTTLLRGRYRVVKCNHCEFIYQAPILGDKGMQMLYHDWVDQERSLQKKKNAPVKLYQQYAGQMKTLSW